jgi:uncharacterized protein (DUF4415 family)
LVPEQALGKTGQSPVFPLNSKQLFQKLKFWNSLIYKPIKKTVNVRLDADVIEWLKSGGEGYQTRMNSILRREMLKATVV